MPLSRFAAFAISLGLLAGCQEQTKQATVAQPVDSASAVGPQCYAFTTAQDTVRLTLQTTRPAVTGELTYQYFEKDRNRGTIRGTLHGDTLRADYTFQSEGRESVREVAFLRRGAGWVEGYGDMAEQAGRLVFKQPAALRFESKNELVPVACLP